MYIEDYKDALDKAAAHKLIGNTRIYLMGERGDRPWEFVTEMAPGCSYRLSMATGVQLTAVIDGITFIWSVEIESLRAGKGYFEIDVTKCVELLSKLPLPAQAQLREYFKECAVTVDKLAKEWQAVATTQRKLAEELCRLGLVP